MSVLRVRAILLSGALVLFVAGAAAHAVNLSGAADADRLGNVVLVVCAVTIVVAFLVPVVRGWLARPRRSDAAVVDDTAGRLVRRAVPGVVVAVIDGASVSFDARGRAGRGTLGLDEATCFEIGSVTKTFTALVLADMVERGEVTLDDPLARFVPERDAGSPITLLDLATHTAGLPRLPPNARLLARALLAHPNPYRGLTDADLEHALQRPRRHKRGRFRYSNFGFALLGLALSRAAGRDWADLVVERVCTPLGLDDTRPALDPALRARAARGHDRFGVPVRSWDFDAIAPAGALHSTARDMASYVRALLDPAATPLAAALTAVQRPRRRRDERDQIGLGWLLRTADGRVVTWHNGGTGGFGSFVGFDTQAGLGVVVLTNAEHSRAVDRAGFALLGREAEDTALRQRL